MVTSICCSIFVFSIGIVVSQKYGPPGYTPGYPITTLDSEIFKGLSYETHSSYHPPLRNNPAQTSYGPPTPTASYGVPIAPTNRFRVIPANEFQIPQQHSNLIRYIVLKEFQVPNGTTPQFQIGEGRNVLAAGNRSQETGIMKVEVPKESAESGATGSSENNGAEQMDVHGGYGNGPNGQGEGQDGDSDYDEDYEDGDMQKNSLPNEIVPAKSTTLTNPRSNSNTAPKSTETQKFMFSDPNSNSIEAENRESSGVRNSLNNMPNRIRNKFQGQRSRNRQRNRNNRNKGEIAGVTVSPIIKDFTSGAPPQPSFSSSENIPQNDELQAALQTLSRYFNAQAQSMRQMMQLGSTQSQSSSTGSRHQNQSSSDTPSVVISVPSPSPSYAPSPTPGYPAGSSVATVRPSSIVGYQSEPGVSGGYANSHPSTPAAADAQIIDSDTPPSTASSIPSPSYGPPPAASSSSGYSGSSSGYGGSGITSLTDAITRPIQLTAGFKSAVINGVANSLTAGIRGVAAATNAVSNSISSVAGAQSGGGSSLSSTYGVPATDPAPVYGAPVYGLPSGSTSGNFSPLRSILGLKGQAVRTAANTGRAALGIAGTKGKLVVTQVGTVANTLTKGISNLLDNNHDAFQSVIRHIQTIFQANDRLKNQQW